MRGALSALQDRGLTLPLEVLKFLVDTAGSNARIGGLYMIGTLGSRAALDYLLALSWTNKEDWYSVYQNAERLAARLNLVVMRTGAGLVLAEPETAHL